ncbi:alpha-L-fucosidase [Dysgonomonas sp. ZJ279]|uniref:alpha-L-fucosidase n=1 Tax=Dysgonomonas sp. ZJ279 TaxID=2709796 RepID=UPI0013EA394E|nr:alpha-L-fucosidase [Dysgonomonas sp. ZJ279]
MKKNLFTIISVLLLSSFMVQGQNQKVEPTWESIKERGYPQWFGDAKLGIFIHWGLYSVPSWTKKEGYSEWAYKGWRDGGSQAVNFAKSVYGPDFKYEDFRSLFKAEIFNPQEWAELFKRSGAKYVILTSKHHDGYALWGSKYSPGWNSVETGPKRDIVGELTTAVENEGLKMGLYYSLPEWSNPLHYWEIDPNDSIARYVDQHMIPQFKEVIGKYKPSVIFTDGEWWNSAEQWHARELIAWYYNLVGKDAIVNDRWGSGADYGFKTPEYSAGITMTDRPWAEVRGLGRSFGLNRNEPLENYLTEEDLIHHFASLVANGGGLTINVGPAGDGQIPLLQQERLVQLGEWLNVNGEAIYGTHAYKKHIEEKPMTINRIDSTINFNWVRNSPDPRIRVDNFTGEWTGYIAPNYSEEYTFTAKADDGVRVWIDNKLIIDQWKKQDQTSDGFVQGAQTTQTHKNSIKLKKGVKYPIKVEYFEDVQNASIVVNWSSKSQKEEVIPHTAFYTDNTPNAPHGLNATYGSLKNYIAYTQKENNIYAILLEWQDDKCVLNIDKPADNSIVTLLGREGNLPWTYQNGQMIIDVSPIKFTEIPCRAAWTLKIAQ